MNRLGGSIAFARPTRKRRARGARPESSKPATAGRFAAMRVLNEHAAVDDARLEVM